MAQLQDVKVSQHGLFRYLVCDKCEKDAMRLYPVPGMGNYCEPCRNITEFETRHYALEGQFQAASDDYHQIIDNIAESTLARCSGRMRTQSAPELLNYECLSQRGLDMAEFSFIRESKHRDGNAWRVLFCHDRIPLPHAGAVRRRRGEVERLARRSGKEHDDTPGGR